MSPEMPLSLERRLSFAAERNMSSAVMQGTVIQPGSKSPSRAEGSCRNLGDPASGRQLMKLAVRIGKTRSRSR